MRRLGLRAVTAAAVALALAGCSGQPGPRPTWSVVSDALAVSAHAGAPEPGQAAAVADAAVRLMAGDADAAPAGWWTVPLSDVPDGRALVERHRPGSNAGVVAVRGRGARSVALAVPVPGGAQPAERLAVDLFVRSEAMALAVAGSPDAAASPEAPFRAVTQAFADRGLTTAVIEGYAVDTSPQAPEVVLQGASDLPSDEELRIGTVLLAAGVTVCVLVGEECHDPGVALEKLGQTPGGPIVRVQLAGRLAGDNARGAAVVSEIAKALDDL